MSTPSSSTFGKKSCNMHAEPLSICVCHFMALWEQSPGSSGLLGRRQEENARSKQLTTKSWFPSVGIQAAGLSGQSSVAFRESGLSELGNLGGLEGCKSTTNCSTQLMSTYKI